MNKAKLIVPYAAWMALMMALPSTPLCYAVRVVVTAAILLWAFGVSPLSRLRASDWGWGTACGILVLAIWIAPENFAWYRQWCIIGDGGVKNLAESGVLLIAIKLVGSALVIPIAEELFFRKWLIGFAGFWWMVTLFALEHDRWVVGAIAGILYGILYLRKGLGAAIVAHAVTNLTLGIYVIAFDQWRFW